MSRSELTRLCVVLFVLGGIALWTKYSPNLTRTAPGLVPTPTPAPATLPRQVSYRVNAVGAPGKVSYRNETGGWNTANIPAQLSKSDPEWAITTTMHYMDGAAVNVQLLGSAIGRSDGWVDCMIYVDGKLIDAKYSKGSDFALVSCVGIIP